MDPVSIGQTIVLIAIAGSLLRTRPVRAVNGEIFKTIWSCIYWFLVLFGYLTMFRFVLGDRRK